MMERKMVKRGWLLIFGLATTTTLGALTVPTLAGEVDRGHGHGRMSGSDGMMQMMGQMHGMMGPGMMGGMDAMSGMMRAFDADGDGTVTPEEVRSGLENRLAEFDADNSGTLSIDEFEALHSAMVRETMVDRFQSLDNDGDGEVTGEEMTALADQMRRMRDSRAQMREQSPGRQPMTPMHGMGAEGSGEEENTRQPGGATERSGN